MLSYSETPIQAIKGQLLEKAGVQLLVKREDLNHPHVQGNKWWKLKYNLEEARRLGHRKILTFGGAYSNHIYATSSAAREFGLECVGIIRGEQTHPINPTLTHAIHEGMQLKYISRIDYRHKTEDNFIQSLKELFGECYIIPEGGTNELAVKGCQELGMKLGAIEFDCLCLPVGTGGTMAGLIAGLPARRIIGVSVLKDGAFLTQEVNKLSFQYTGIKFSTWDIRTEYHFGGYAKSTANFIDFIRSFEVEHAIPLDPVYTGKMVFGILDLIGKATFKRGTTILALHTGGLQGNVSQNLKSA